MKTAGRQCEQPLGHPSYGAKGVDNGVNVRFDDKIDGGVTEVSGVANGENDKENHNPNKQNINVTFSSSGAQDASLVGHEGSHVADGSEWVGSGFSSSKNPTSNKTEMDANHVQFNILNAEYSAKYNVSAGGYYTAALYGGSVTWKNGASFQSISTDLQKAIQKENGSRDTMPAFRKGGVLPR